MTVTPHRKMNSKPTRYIAALISFGVCLCIFGIGLIIAGSLSFETFEKQAVKNGSRANESQIDESLCALSDEAVRVQLYDTIGQVMDIYYELYPNKIIWTELKQFRPYNCTPSALKYRTDVAKQLHEEVKELRNEINEKLLKPRELKSLIQLLHFLKSDFGQPYGENYYAGDWMMGPSRFCEENICKIGSDLHYHFNEWSWQPSSYADVSYILEQVRGYSPLIKQYIANTKYGVTAGMVRSIEQCEAGYYSLVSEFQQTSALGKKGILSEWFTASLLDEEYLKNVPKDDVEKWFKTFGETMTKSINTTLVEYVGKPLVELIHYLKHEHRSYCVPSNISSGLASLPLKYIYTKGSRTTQTTTQMLPTGEKLNGTKSYDSILYFFTTSENLTAEDIYEMGVQQLHKLYPKAISAAQNVTKQSGKAAVASFKKMLNNQSSFFNDEPFPSNESNEVAFSKCTNLTQAKIYCPKRYKAFENWSAFVREILSLLEPKTINMFHFTGEKRTTPNCPVKVVPNFNPKTGSQSYRSSGNYCDRSCTYRLPFFMDNLGPNYNAFSVAGHEGRPGHHTQLQGYAENFYDGCDDVITWLDSVGDYPLFAEGWALYAENPLLASDTDVYDKNPLQKYGMLKWQIWRAIRLIVDTGMHYKGMKRHEALAYHEQYAWDTTDKAVKDVTRYQSNPGQATAYMIGQLEIWKLRELTKRKLEEGGKKFSLKDFHFQVLSQGKSPMEYLKIHINKYIECVLSGSSNCDALATGLKLSTNERRQRNFYKKMYPVENFRVLRERYE